MKSDYIRPLDIRHGSVDLSHGGGGRAMVQLIADVFARAFDNQWLRQRDDAAVLPAPGPGEQLVMATDAHVVSPLFFPGGDIGSLSVHGTVNDVAVMGARPLYLAASFILEEGFALADLQRIVTSMAVAAREAGVPVVTGDTKVVEKGKGDGVFITTTGLGALPEGRRLSGAHARPGDAVIVSGTLGDHGMAIMAHRESLAFESEIRSDTAALHGLAARAMEAAPGLRLLRDPTRGGLAATLNEIAHQSGVGIVLDEAAIPVARPVAAACEFLGLDPLYIANEGKLVAVCPAEEAESLLSALRAHPLGAHAARVGEVIADGHRFVQMRTLLGGRRMVDWLAGEQLPRIC
ncbi:hydrogenase expression/formation protein HypE [Zoogloea sp.]|uniref:hydrogenase expression/formation protein HypE n=1 Tax=Zoogloea sp. TaxID=49181 RepID=UPI00260788A8|nr:hydrogenase expression/formation protein HypE [Zoogloea sp.]MDD3354900.1 hydrogenase expression/formation protein HypE [Zoogloea sp.]